MGEQFTHLPRTVVPPGLQDHPHPCPHSVRRPHPKALKDFDRGGLACPIRTEESQQLTAASLVRQGGRLYYVVQNNFGYYLSHPQDILATWQGGMAFYGAFFAGPEPAR